MGLPVKELQCASGVEQEEVPSQPSSPGEYWFNQMRTCTYMYKQLFSASFMRWDSEKRI